MHKNLSIIIPSYNMEKYLPKCLGSLVVAQELMEELEVLVVNDGSKDRTSEIAHEFEAKFPQTFKVIDKPNGHYGSCINAALKIASGKYIKVLDADDSFDTKNFEEYLRFVAAPHAVDLITNDFDIVDEDGMVTKQEILPYPRGSVFGMVDLVAPKYELIMHGVAYRTEIFREIGYRQTEGIVFTDTEWMFRPMLEVKTVRHFAKPVYRYLVGREGQSVDPNLAVNLLPAQVKVFNNILKIYEKEAPSIGPEYRAYMEINLARIYRILLTVYFAFAPLKRLKEEFVSIHQRTMAVAPDCVVVTTNFGKIMEHSWLGCDCVRKWRGSGYSSFWPFLFRFYAMLKKKLSN